MIRPALQLAALSLASIAMIPCAWGQSAAFNGIAASELAPQVDMAVSAMTAVVRRQAEGWAILH